MDKITILLYNIDYNFESMKQKLIFERQSIKTKGTPWRPLSHISLAGERLSQEQLTDFVSSGSKAPIPIRVADPYSKIKLIEGFVIDPDTLTVWDKQLELDQRPYSVETGVMSLFWGRVSIGNLVSVGEMSEIRQGVQLYDDAAVGQYSFIGKNTIVESGAEVGGFVWVGQDCRVSNLAKIATGTIFEKDCSFGDRSDIGMQGRIQKGTYIGSDVWLDNDIRIEPYTRIHDSAMIGEGVYVSPYSVIGANAIIGANSIKGTPGSTKPSGYVGPREFVPAGSKVSISGILSI